MNSSLDDCVRRSLARYFRDLDGARPHAIYDMVLASVERPMFEFVLRQTQGNQTEAAALLGISRSTLRRKLAQYQLDNLS